MKFWLMCSSVFLACVGLLAAHSVNAWVFPRLPTDCRSMRIRPYNASDWEAVRWLFVHPAHRRQGVARALLNVIMGRLKGTVTLNVGPWNLAACRLYESLGFVKVREFPGTFNGPDVAVLTMETSPR